MCVYWFLFCPPYCFFLANKKGEIIHKVHALSYKKSAGFDVVLFDNVHDEFEAKNLADLEVLIEKDTSVLDKNEYLYTQIAYVDFSNLEGLEYYIKSTRDAVSNTNINYICNKGLTDQGYRPYHEGCIYQQIHQLYLV